MDNGGTRKRVDVQAGIKRFLFPLAALFFLVAVPADANTSLRFFGNGVNDIDRVKIPIDPPVPADIGATDFTLEFWMKASAADNTAPAINCASNNWISGNIVFDRDRFDQDRNYGISIAGGSIAFGVMGSGFSAATICSSRNVLDGQWHHVAVQRRLSDGRMWIYIDGVLEAQGDGPTGDASYPDGYSSSYPNDPYLVIGAEKHDADNNRFPSYSGWVDEVRLSSVIRYTGAFTPPATPFAPDADTVALYHFDEGSGVSIADSSGAPGGPSDGLMNVGGNPTGPLWSTDTPFAGVPPSPGTLQFVSATYTVDENEPTAQARIRVRRTGGSAGAVSVSYTVDASSTAALNTDYTLPATQVLNWADGDSVDKEFVIGIMDDNEDEPNETVVLQLGSPTGGAVLGSPGNTTLTIVDDDGPGTLRFATAALSVNESDPSAIVVVRREGGTSGAVSVTYTVVETISGAANYSLPAPTQRTLNWGLGDGADKLITIPLVDDARVEGDDILQLTLDAATVTGGAGLGSPASMQITVNDDDSSTPPPPPAGVSTARSGGGGCSLGPSGRFDPLFFVLLVLSAAARLRSARTRPRTGL